jgi:hypothetical protein
VGEHSASAPERSVPGCVWPPERMQRALRSLHAWNRGLLGEVQQARLLQQVRKEHKQGLIGTQDFAHQHETQ